MMERRGNDVAGKERRMNIAVARQREKAEEENGRHS